MHKLALAVITYVTLVNCAAVSEPRPSGRQGKEADELAQVMLRRINLDGWNATKAVTWNFGSRRTHLWDRERNYDLYKKDTREVLLRLDDQTGIVRDNGQVVTGPDADKALKDAWEAWVNDSFWLNAPAKCFDEGVQRSLVHDDEGDHLLVSYTSGGVTPGDAYLWDLENGLPTRWRMWTQVLPIGGAKASWDQWVQLPTGAWISTMHVMTAKNLPLTDVRGAATLAELVPGDDPFAAL